MSETLIGVIVGGILGNTPYIIGCISKIIQCIVKKIQRFISARSEKRYTKRMLEYEAERTKMLNDIIKNDITAKNIIQCCKKWSTNQEDGVCINEIKAECPELLKFILHFYKDDLCYRECASQYNEESDEEYIILDSCVFKEIYERIIDARLQSYLNNI